MKSKKAGPARKTAAPVSRRSRGRPRARQGAVGREVIVAAARKLLEKLPPHKATISSIARSAGVDPALVRYYFGSREELLLAVIESILSSWKFTRIPVTAEPSAKLAGHVRDMLDFALSVRSMQQLMIDECANSKSPEVRRRVRELNAGAVSRHALLLHSGKRTRVNATDPLFMHVAIIGMCEFFAAAQSMITPLVPAGVSADQLVERYKTFIVRLVLDGMRSRLEPWSAGGRGKRLPGS